MEKLQDLDLPLDLPDHVQVLHLLAVQYLYGDNMASDHMLGSCRTEMMPQRVGVAHVSNRRPTTISRINDSKKTNTKNTRRTAHNIKVALMRKGNDSTYA